MTISDELIISQTKTWLMQVVIGSNFCPFAAREYNRGSIRYVVVPSRGLEVDLQSFLAECRHLDVDTATETTLLIFPDGYPDFDEFLDLSEYADALIVDMGFEGVYQVATFHPDYLFEGVDDDDPANYTNRSLYPMLHLLREESLERAILAHPDPEGIPDRNIEYARNQGLARMKLLREACFSGN